MLLFRERAATTVTIAALIAGAVATSWIYLNGISSRTVSGQRNVLRCARNHHAGRTACYLMGAEATLTHPSRHLT